MKDFVPKSSELIGHGKEGQNHARAEDRNLQNPHKERITLMQLKDQSSSIDEVTK